MPETQDPFRLLRFILAIFVGIVLTYGVGQLIEIGLVVYAHGSIPQDSTQYLMVRNHPQVLLARLFYTAALGFGAGYLAALIGRQMGILAGIALAFAQVVAIIWAMISRNPIYSYTPVWMWLALLVITPPAIISGAWIRGRRYAEQR
jgi:hypothetical protein